MVHRVHSRVGFVAVKIGLDDVSCNERKFDDDHTPHRSKLKHMAFFCALSTAFNNPEGLNDKVTVGNMAGKL